MAACEHEAQPVVFDALFVPWRGRVVRYGIDLLRHVLHRDEARTPAYAIDRLEATGRHQPRPRVRRHALARPLLERGTEGLVQRLLGNVEVAQEADQRSKDAAGLVAIDGLCRLARAHCGLIAHWRHVPR